MKYNCEYCGGFRYDCYNYFALKGAKECVWRKVIENDLEKISSGIGHPALLNRRRKVRE